MKIYLDIYLAIDVIMSSSVTPCIVAKLYTLQDKTAELSQRRPRDAPNIWVP